MFVINIIFKFVFKNIKEKKFRTFLIVFAIMISSALLFASSAISGTMGKMYAEKMKQYYGSAELVIEQNSDSPSPFFHISGAQKHVENFEYIIGAHMGSCVYNRTLRESDNISLLGIDYDDLQVMNPFEVYSQSKLKPFAGKKIIISQNTAQKYNLEVGNQIDLSINNIKHTFFISAIVYPSGIFVDDGMSTYAVIPRDTLAQIYNAKGKVGIVYLKPKGLDKKTELTSVLSKEYPRYSVKEPFSKSEMEQQSAPLTTSFFLMTIIVFLMSVFIIYSSFKVVTMERLPVIGTFRSIGATRKMTDIVLLAESLIYGTIGGAIGCGLGIGILYIMSYLSKPVWVKGFSATIEFYPSHLITAFAAAILLSIISSIIPIIKVSKIPVKDIVLNSIDKKQKNKRFRLIFGIAGLATSVIMPPLLPTTQAFILLVICMVISIVAVIQLIPYISNIIVRVFERLYSLVFGNIGILAAKNLKENKSIHNNITLLSIGISSLLMINIMSFSVGKEVVNAYNDFNFDIWISNNYASRNLENVLQTVDGVSSICGAYEINNVEIMGKNSEIMVLHGIDKNEYPNFWNVHIQGNQDELLNELNNDRNILITNAIQERLSLKKGDNIDLKIGEQVKHYKVLGFFNTLMYNGNYAVIADKYLKADAKLYYYSQFFIKTSKSPDEVEKNIKNKLPRSEMWMTTIDNMENLNMQSNNQMFSILNGFSVLAMIIGIFGVLNNYVISFIERKRWMAVFRSIGMKKGQIIKMLFIESLTCGIIGGTAGILSGLILIENVSYILKAMNLPIAMHMSPALLLNSMLGGILITLLASVSPAFKTSKLNIIESIKYE